MSELAVLNSKSSSVMFKPPAGAPDVAGLDRCGFALSGDLERPDVRQILGEMESFQAEFMAATRELWKPSFPFTGDCLYNWSRRWEYPYCWSNLPGGDSPKVLDAGSGITFFPYFLDSAGFEVSCADLDAGLKPVFESANAAMGKSIDYRVCSIDALKWPDESFDVVACVSVLEHAPTRAESIAEMARVLKPGGRLVLTWDVSLSRDCDIVMEDVAILLALLKERFQPLHPVDLVRPHDLLTTDRVLSEESWRLAWRKRKPGLRRLLSTLRHGDSFHSLAVLGSTWVKPE